MNYILTLFTLIVLLVGSSLIAQETQKTKIGLELSTSINAHYQFQEVQIGYGIGLGVVKEKSPRVRRYLGLEVNKNFNPLNLFKDHLQSGHPAADSKYTSIEKLSFVDLLIPYFYEISIIKKQHQLFGIGGGYLSVPMGGKVKGIELDYSDEDYAVAIDERITGRNNVGGILGLGMRFSTGKRDLFTLRVDTRFDLLSTMFGSDYFNNRYIRFSVGYTFENAFTNPVPN